MNQEARCENCTKARVVEVKATKPGKTLPDRKFECRALPPQVVNDGGQESWRYPIVGRDGWCASWELSRG